MSAPFADFSGSINAVRPMRFGQCGSANAVQLDQVCGVSLP
jgi:hypothetical protein